MRLLRKRLVQDEDVVYIGDGAEVQAILQIEGLRKEHREGLGGRRDRAEEGSAAGINPVIEGDPSGSESVRVEEEATEEDRASTHAVVAIEPLVGDGVVVIHGECPGEAGRPAGRPASLISNLGAH
jgi:hypothetical protein